MYKLDLFIGSIWVRVFGAIWAACDLSFMKSVQTFGMMNEIVLVGGFSFGILFGILFIIFYYKIII